MARLRLLPVFGILLVLALSLSTVQAGQHFALVETGFSVSQDTGDPDIYHWGIEGEPELGQGFDVWANVTDEES
jgi:hypothetical protein